MHGQVPIEIYRDSIGYESWSPPHTHDTDIFQEDTIEEVDDLQLMAAVEKASLIVEVPPRRHFETDISKTDHLQVREFLGHPAQTWEVDREVIEEDGPDHPDVEVEERVFLAEFPQGLDVPNVDGEMTSGDGVCSSAFFDEVPFFFQSIHLTRTIVRILLMDGDGEWKKNSILDATDGSKRNQDAIQGSALSFPVSSSRNITTETDERKIPKNWMKI